MQVNPSEIRYTRIHAPIMPLAVKKADGFDSEDVEAGLRKIYSGKVDYQVCLNCTGQDTYKQAVEMALLVHVVHDGGTDKNVILTDEKRRERRIVADYVGIFTALYQAVEKGNVTNDQAYGIVSQQIGLRKAIISEFTVNSWIRQAGIFKSRPQQTPGGRGMIEILTICKKIQLTRQGIIEAHGDLLPKDFEIARNESHAVWHLYNKMVKEIIA